MKYHIEKNTVQETLVIPLFGRLVCSERFPELFSDLCIFSCGDYTYHLPSQVRMTYNKFRTI